MANPRFIYDGLWRCLCPAVDARAFREAVKTPLLFRRAPRGARSTITLPVHNRRYGTGSAVARMPFEEQSTGTPIAKSKDITTQTWEERLLAPNPPSDETLAIASVEVISQCLRTLREPRGWHVNTGQELDRYSRILQLVTHLIVKRNQPLRPFMYECIMDAMTDPQGSVTGVRKLMKEMSSQGMAPSETLCKSVLAALMTHPDYLLRLEILDVMRSFWYPVDTLANQSVVIGLLRDEQYEMAYMKLTGLIEQGARIDLWVYDIFILVFGKLRFLDEMLVLVHRRKLLRDTDNVILGLLYYTLDVCSQNFHHQGTTFAWNAVVRNPKLQPADGIVENVLGTAARHGDTKLGTEALDLLAQRTRVQAYHYEAVAEAFCKSEDIAGAFRIFIIMANNGIRISRRNTRAITQALRHQPRLIKDASSALEQLHLQEKVPVAVVGALIEVTAETKGSEKALSLYYAASRLCGEPPSSSMIQDLIIHSKDAELTKRLLKDYMEHIPAEQDARSSQPRYDKLIRLCVETGYMELAFRFAHLAISSVRDSTRPTLLMVWFRVLVKSSMEREDGRIWSVIDRLSKAGDEAMSTAVQRVLQNTRLMKRPPHNDAYHDEQAAPVDPLVSRES